MSDRLTDRPTDRSINLSIDLSIDSIEVNSHFSFSASYPVSERQEDLVSFVDTSSQITVSRKPDFWHKMRMCEFTSIESIDESIDRSVGRSAVDGRI